MIPQRLHAFCSVTVDAAYTVRGKKGLYREVPFTFPMLCGRDTSLNLHRRYAQHGSNMATVANDTSLSSFVQNVWFVCICETHSIHGETPNYGRLG